MNVENHHDTDAVPSMGLLEDEVAPIEISVRDQVIEQVMRTTCDDAVLVPFLTAEPASTAAHAALGRLLGDTRCELVTGCPLLAFFAGTRLDENWRIFCPPLDDSLWQNFEFLAQLFGRPEGVGPYEGLELLRDQASTSA